MNRKPRRAFKVRVEDAPSEMLLSLARARVEQAEAVVENTRWQSTEILTPDHLAGPFKHCYTAQLLAEAKSGMTTVAAMQEMRAAEEYCVRIGAWQHHSPFYTSICEALSILRPQQ